MHTSLRSECTKSKAYALPWTEPTSEQVLVLSRLRTKGGLPEMAVNPWVRESPAYQRHKRSHATYRIQTSDQSAQNPRRIHCLGLNQLRNRSKACLGAYAGVDLSKSTQLPIELVLISSRHMNKNSYIKQWQRRELCVRGAYKSFAVECCGGWVSAEVCKTLVRCVLI